MKLAARQIDILDPQAQAFLDAHADAVEQADDQAVGIARQAAQQGLRLGDGKHHGQPLVDLGAGDAVEPGQGDAEHIAIQKQDGVHGLVLGAGGYV